MTVQNKPDNHKLLRCWLLWIFNLRLPRVAVAQSDTTQIMTMEAGIVAVY